MNAWTWTVFQLMTQAAINEHDETLKKEVADFVGHLLDGNNPANNISCYK